MDLKDKRNLPIGFMDSGLGGLSVLKEAIKLMPSEDFIYYGDSANAPYGTRDPKEIEMLTFKVVDKLMAKGIKGLAVACNTATSAAVSKLRIKYPDLPIVGIEPAIKPAIELAGDRKILVMATPMTIKQEKFCRLLKLYNSKSNIIPVPCKGLMEFVEHGDLTGEFLENYFKEHLDVYLSNDIAAIVLGCTHYPFLKPQLKAYLNNRDIALIDGSLGTSQELKRRLKEAGLLNDEQRQGNIIIENSLNNQEMLDLSWKLLRLPID